MTAVQVRMRVKLFLRANDSMSQNKVAVKADVAKSTMSAFMKRKTDLSKAELKRIVKVVCPELYDARLVGAGIKVGLIKRGFTDDELAIIASQIG